MKWKMHSMDQITRRQLPSQGGRTNESTQGYGWELSGTHPSGANAESLLDDSGSPP
jgi:hypothetical protein